MATISEPTTPIRVPKAAATYDITTLDPELRSQINGILLRDGSIQKIHDRILHTLHTDATNWTTLIQARCRELLRSGTCTTFAECKAQVLSDIRADTFAARGKEVLSNGMVGKAKPNGTGTGNGNGVKGRGEAGESLAVPEEVVKEGVRITRECLEGVVEVNQ